jgi:WD40 repeat protein
MEEQTRDFFDWRFHSCEFYSTIIMHVLPQHPISVSFTRETVRAGDSSVFGLILGIPGPPSSITLYNCLFPNRRSASFSKNHPNPAWGKATPMRLLPVPDRLLTCAVNPNNDILASTESSLLFFGESSTATISTIGHGQITLIQCSPADLSTDAFLASEAGEVFHMTAAERLTMVARFRRPVIDLAIDPFQPGTALVTQGKSHVHLVDQRTPLPVPIKLMGHTSAVSFSPEIPFVFAAGQFNGMVNLFDSRHPTRPSLSISAHDSQVTTLKWSPHHKDIVASASVDTSLALWSVHNTDADEALVFSHNGHVAPIVGFDWCKDVPWTIASISEDNVFEIWTIAKSELEDYLYPD